ncbi:kinesin-like protein KIF28 [Babylonia areolata]|uniref:kinesin-like protein KIF28 n=1 Tax=Babylonia areolata TaxID=304850 RepID=UPI003FD01E02
MPEENVKVAVRVRPFNSREINRKAALVINMSGNTTEIKNPEDMNAEPKKFAFDYSYWSHDGFKEEADGYLSPSDAKYADQKKVFNDLGFGVLENAWKGYNCSLFAYGQTGSGKSYSMVGYGNNKGIIPLACDELFKGIEDKRQKAGKDEDYQVTLSMLEIYNEQVRDLLSSKPPQKGGLKVRQHPNKGFYDQKSRDCALEDNKSSNIQFCERADSTGATGDRLKEGSAINQSLSMLGNCIAALASNSSGKKKTVVPFRDSVLTKLLQNALGGNSKTVMIAALSPADINYEETLSTLRFADRAKQIKTSAIVNESPTDKLIRELREENQRLMELLKQGGGAAAAAMIGQTASAGEPDGEVEEMKRALEEQMKKNQEELEEMKKSYEERMKETQATSAGQADAAEKTQEERKVIPHFWNLNEDPSLTGVVAHFCREGTSKVGNKKASPAPQILLNGLSIQANHAVVTNKKGTVTLKPESGAKVLVNGQPVKAETTLRHNDRVLFGSNHLYVFHHPQDEAKMLKEGTPLKEPSYDDAQQEIVKQSGLVKDGANKDDLLLQEDLIELLPMVNEANAMSEELDKKVKYELALVSPQARGLKEGRTEVMVKMRNLDNGNEFMLDRNKFINRKYLMQEMYQNFMEGDKDWDVPKEKDPFWEPADSTDVQIGSVHVFLQSLAYLVELEENLSITDYKGNDKGHLQVEIRPCDKNWKALGEDVFVDDTKELLGKPLNFIIKILGARGLPANMKKTFCSFKFYVDDKATKTKEVADTINPDFSFDKKCSYPAVTQELLNYLNGESLVVEVWGRQKEEGFKSGADKNKLTTKDLMSRERSNLDKASGAAGAAAGAAAGKGGDSVKPQPKSSAGGAASQPASGNNSEALGKIYGLIDQAKAKGVTSIPIGDIEASLYKHFADSPAVRKPTAAPAPAKGGGKAKKETSSRACVLQ